MNRRWILMALVFFGILINYVDRGNLSIAAPAIMSDFRVLPGTMGVILSTFFWTYCLCQIPAGALVDRLGIRWAYAAAFLLWSLASAGIALSRSTRDIVGLRMALGVAESITPLASLAFIRRNFEGKDQGLPTSIYIAGQNIGPALGALLGTILLDRFGWRRMFAITGLGGLIWLPFWLLATQGDGAVEAPVPKASAGDLTAAQGWPMRELLGSRAFWAITASILLSSYYWYFVLTWIPSYLVLARGFSTLGMGRVLSAALFAMAVVNICFGVVVDRLAARIGVFPARLLFAVVGYAGTTPILLLLVTGRAWALPILTFSVCLTGIGISNFWSMAQHVPPRSMVGRTIGYLNTISVMGGIAAPIITGYILGPQKHFGPAIVVAGVCPLLAAICMMIVGTGGLDQMKALLAGEA